MKLVPCALSCSMLFASLALAEPVSSTPSTQATTVAAAVKRILVSPLKEREAKRSMYSRVSRPPAERRVRVLDASPVRDADGREFFAFAIDERRGGGKWTKDAMVGCLYPAGETAFVKRGDSYRPVEVLLGKPTTTPPATACLPAGGGALAEVL